MGEQHRLSRPRVAAVDRGDWDSVSNSDRFQATDFDPIGFDFGIEPAFALQPDRGADIFFHVHVAIGRDPREHLAGGRGQQILVGLFSGPALFVTDSSNSPGFYAAEASPRDLTTESNVTSLDGYDPSTTRLTGLTFADPWRLAHFGSVPQDGEYNYFIEFTIDTPGGSYRASTQKLDRATAFQNTTAQLGFVFNWEGGGFLGDPFASGGVALSDITNMTYNVLVEVVTPTTSGAGFFLVEGFNLEYEVTAIPEPASLLLFAGMIPAFAIRRR